MPNSLLSRVWKAHIYDYISDHWPLFALFQLQFGAMSPNGAIKPERASLVDIKLKELVVMITACYVIDLVEWFHK